MAWLAFGRVCGLHSFFVTPCQLTHLRYHTNCIFFLIFSALIVISLCLRSALLCSSTRVTPNLQPRLDFPLSTPGLIAAQGNVGNQLRRTPLAMVKGERERGEGKREPTASDCLPACLLMECVNSGQRSEDRQWEQTGDHSRSPALPHVNV